MTSELWRKGLLYTGMSLFFAWHTLALVVAPMPDGIQSLQPIRSMLEGYMTFFGLNNKWDFYAPQIGGRRQLRYVIEDAAGKRSTVVPSDEMSGFNPAYWWFRAWYSAIMDYPDYYADPAADMLCRQHMALNPVAITFLQAEQDDFSPTDQLSGKGPMDPEFVTVSTLKRVRCQDR
jgi:hypothetical protein